MFEHKIMLPCARNDGIPYTHKMFLERVRDIAGGYTVAPLCDGEWQDEDGVIYRDKVTPIFVACEHGALMLIESAFFECYPDQKCLYRVTRGEAHFIPNNEA